MIKQTSLKSIAITNYYCPKADDKYQLLNFNSYKAL